jgi:hypothetical protein
MEPSPNDQNQMVGEPVEVSVNFTAPTKAGVYLSGWHLANANGTPFPRPIYVKIVVK